MTVGGIVALMPPPVSPETAKSAMGDPNGSGPAGADGPQIGDQSAGSGRPGNNASREPLPLAAKVLSTALFSVSIVTGGGGVWLLMERPSAGLALAAFVTSAFFFLATVVVPLGMAREIRLEREEARNCQADCQDLDHALPSDSTQYLQQSLKHLTVANFKQMRTFTGIAQRQARMSYYASLLGASLSLLVLLAGAAAAIGVPTLAGKVAAGSLAAVGTALSAFLSKTFLRAYDMGLRQMSYYYGQPLVHCYLYHAEWLTLLAPPEIGEQAKREMWQEVVRASLRASANAQHHLLSLREHDPWGGRHGRSFRQLTSPPGLGHVPPVGTPGLHDGFMNP